MRAGGWVGKAAAGLTVAMGILAGPPPLDAQEPEAKGRPSADSIPVVTLQDAVAIARAANPNFRQAVASLDLNGVEHRATLATQVPPIWTSRS